MGRFTLTIAAQDDLAQIASFIEAQGSSEAAQKVGLRLREAMRTLADTPAIGHVRADLADASVRFWPVYSYLIIFLPDTRPLQVLRVLHAARDVEAILRSAPH